MIKNVIFSLLLFFPIHLFGQIKIEDYVRNNVSPVLTIEPDSTNYSDLDVIGNAIGNARIVMLGEQDHGDAPTFLAKTRIIKYLHEKKGFNILAFESNFFGLNYDWDLVRNGKMNIDTFILSDIYPIWTQCDACKELFYQYIPATQKTNNPVQLTGFDNQMYSKNLFPVLDSILQNINIPITRTSEYKSQIFPLITSWYKYSKQKDSDTTNQIIGYLSEIKNQMLQKISSDNFWVMVVENLIQENIEFQNIGKDYWKTNNTRDKQMALNLKWLSEVKYSKDKIIVWAHNYHISKYNSHYPEDFMNSAKTMGGDFTSDNDLNKETYIIGFTSYSGTAGRLSQKKYDLPKPKKNSFENWINKKYDFAFIDFKPYNLNNPTMNEDFYMSGSVKGNMLHSYNKAQWNKIFDGVFFIRNMYPCERVVR